MILVTSLGCAHAVRSEANGRVTAASSVLPGVCRPEPRYRASEFKDDGIRVWADPAAVSESTVSLVGQAARAAKRDLQNFFNLVGPATYSIFIAASTEDFDALAGTQTDWEKFDWIVGLRLRDGTHVIRDPKTWSAKSRTFVKIDELIKHEMAHSFDFALNGKGQMPDCVAEGEAGGLGGWLWIEEGLASYAAGQHLTWRGRAKFDFEKFPRFAQIADYGNYTTAASAVDYLITRFSKDRVFNVIRALPPNYSSTTSPRDVSAAIATEFAPVPLAELERGWRKFALRTYREEEK